jgi:hypothetical protein
MSLLYVSCWLLTSSAYVFLPNYREANMKELILDRMEHFWIQMLMDADMAP